MSRSGADAWHAGRMILPLASHFNWFQNLMMTEFEIDGGRADLVFITRSGYLTEIEIKVSLADWNADREKAKFLARRENVARFYYAVPEPLADKIPAWVPDDAGLLVVFRRGEPGHDYVREQRAAKRSKAKKIPESYRKRLIENCYHRYWHLRLLQLRQQRDSRMAA